MGHIYYAFGIVILLSLITNIIRFNRLYKIREWYSKFKKITNKEPNILDFRNKSDKSLLSNHNILLSIELMWILFGLISNSWYIFSFILIMGFLLNISFKKIKFTIIGKLISLKFLLLRTSLYIFLIINHFHLHIDLLDIILKSF